MGFCFMRVCAKNVGVPHRLLFMVGDPPKGEGGLGLAEGQKMLYKINF